MRILIADWPVTRYGTEPRVIEVQQFDLENRDHLMGLIFAAGTGRFEESCIESDCIEACEVARGLLQGTGGAKRVECREIDKSRRLYRPAYEIYDAGELIYFLNPNPRPALFSENGGSDYIEEFGTDDVARNA